MDYRLIVPVVLISIAALLAIILQWFNAFYKKPIHASLRALMGLIALLVGSHGIPEIEGTVNLSADWGWFMTLQDTNLTVTTGVPLAVQGFAWVSISALIGICLIRVPTEPS